MNCIAISTHKRPEFLTLCLESLLACRGIEKYHIYIGCNEDSNPEIFEIVHRMLKGFRHYQLDIRPPGWLIERANGETFKAGAKLSNDYFISLNEDLMVSKDFLEYHEYVAADWLAWDILASCNQGVTPGDGPEAVRKVRGHLATDGCLLPKNQFNKYLLPHLCEGFYNQESRVGDHSYYRPTYMSKYWPIGAGQGLGLDGMMECIMRKEALASLYPGLPRCRTIGFYGAHTLANLDVYDWLFRRCNNTAERVERLKLALTRNEMPRLWGPLWAYNHKEMQPDHQWEYLKPVGSWS